MLITSIADIKHGNDYQEYINELSKWEDEGGSAFLPEPETKIPKGYWTTDMLNNLIYHN